MKIPQKHDGLIWRLYRQQMTAALLEMVQKPVKAIMWHDADTREQNP
jgi:hypothetical protein